MFTTGSKWFLGLGVVSLLLAFAYGWSTGGNGLGPLTAGYKGGVGDHLGYGILLSIALTAIFLGIVSIATRDASPKALAELAGTETAPEVLPPSSPTAYWPVLGAFGATLVVLGLVISNVMFVIGFLVLLVVLVEWMVEAWSDRATGDPAANRQIRTRIMGPFEVPLLGSAVAAGGVWAFSRMLLTSSKMGAVVVATVLGVVILGVGWLLAAKPKVSANVVAGILALCALGAVIGGVASAARGERFIEHHHHESELSPYIPAGTSSSGVPSGDAEEEG